MRATYIKNILTSLILLYDGYDLTESHLIDRHSSNNPAQEDNHLCDSFRANITIANSCQNLERPVHAQEVELQI